MPESALLAYGDTARRSFPLILIFGREFNGVGDVEPKVGGYHFQGAAGRSRFWNRSYRLVAHHHGSDLKSAVRRCGYSPILFSNALPISIRNAVGDKTPGRDAVTPERIESHMQSIFRLPILKRLRCVVASGLDRGRLCDAKHLIQRECLQRGIHFIKIGYLGSGLRSDVLYALDPGDASALRKLVDDFYLQIDVVR